MIILNIKLNQIQTILAESINMEELDENNIIKLQITNPEIKENKILAEIIKNERSLKEFLLTFIDNTGLNDLDISIDDTQNIIEIKANNGNIYLNLNQLLNDVFYGDFFQQFSTELTQTFDVKFGDEFKL
jgi:hypothetical protein